MEKLITVGLSTFLTFKAAFIILIISNCLVESILDPSKISVIFTIIVGMFGLIGFFTATLRLSEKIIFRINKREISINT